MYSQYYEIVIIVIRRPCSFATLTISTLEQLATKVKI